MRLFVCVCICLLLSANTRSQTPERNPHQRLSFDAGWRFHFGDIPPGGVPATATPPPAYPGFNDKNWRSLDLPHDWSIEGEFGQGNPTGEQEAGLPAGIGWYRKTFRYVFPAKGAAADKVYVDFDGVYRNSEVWINGHSLGKRPNGYISFRYELTPWLKKDADNVLSVRVDNSGQPNSRWYTGSGIYRHVWLGIQTASPVAIDQWGILVSTGESSPQQARLRITTTLRIAQPSAKVGCTVRQVLYDSAGAKVATLTLPYKPVDTLSTLQQDLPVANPHRWGTDHPYLYTLETSVFVGGRLVDRLRTRTGIRTAQFDLRQGFLLNDRHMKIEGVCLHHDLGALGAAVNASAMRRQLLILKEMGCNAIRTTHNPPAPELLDLCDELGFLVMDEAFDMWQKKKNEFDYSLDFPLWWGRDLADQIRRDRNHPCVFIWSIGNEMREQFDDTGVPLTKELAAIVRRFDPTRPVTAALSEPDTLENSVYQAGVLDVIGLNYNPAVYDEAQHRYAGRPFLATETTPAPETRGRYEIPDDSIAYWGSIHEETWRIVKRNPFVAGVFVGWGFDYLGEPSPYKWPARSSYSGIVDLAGFPKDIYYFYQAEWSSKPVLHLLPHWNWQPGQLIDVWAYFNNANEVELFLNGRSLGVRKKTYNDLHVSWQVPFESGTLKAVSRLYGREVMSTQIQTAGAPARVELVPDRKTIKADGSDLSFVTMRIVDANGIPVTGADSNLAVTVSGEGSLAGMDNGYPADLESFRSDHRKAFNGLCVAIIRSKKKAGRITLHVSGSGLPPADVEIISL